MSAPEALQTWLVSHRDYPDCDAVIQARSAGAARWAYVRGWADMHLSWRRSEARYQIGQFLRGVRVRKADDA